MRRTRTTPLIVITATATLLLVGCSDGEGTEAPIAEDPVSQTEVEVPDEEVGVQPTETSPTEPSDVVEGADPDDAPADAVEDDGDAVVQGDGFTITFPAPPDVETVPVPLEEGLSTEATIYQVQVDEAFLGFSHADTPDVGETADFDEEQALRDSAQGAADNTGGEVVEADIVDFQGRTAIDYHVVVPGGVLRGIAFFDDRRLYTGQLVAEGEDIDRAPLDAMMDSLVLA